MAKLARGIDELEHNVLQGSARGVRHQGLAKSQNALLHTNARALDHDEVLVDNTIVREATHRSDLLDGQVELGASAGLVGAGADAVDLLVHLSAVMVTVLTSAGNREANPGRMPGTDTGDLAETLVSLPRKLASTPTGSDTLETVTLGDTNDVNVLVLLEHGRDGDFLLKVAVGPVDLVFDGATVQLDLHDMGLLLADAQLSDLSVGDDSDDGGVLLQLLQTSLDVLGLTSLVLLGVLGEGFLLALGPVLVEAALDVVAQVLSPDGGDGAETARSLGVAGNTDNHHRRSLDDGDSLEDFLLVELGAWAVQVTDDVGHTGLVAHETGQVHRLGGIILGEGLAAGSLAGSALPGEESERTVARGFEFTVRL